MSFLKSIKYLQYLYLLLNLIVVSGNLDEKEQTEFILKPLDLNSKQLKCPVEPRIKVLNQFGTKIDFSADAKDYFGKRSTETETETEITEFVDVECSSREPATWDIQGYRGDAQNLIQNVIVERVSISNKDDLNYHRNDDDSFCHKTTIQLNISFAQLYYTDSSESSVSHSGFYLVCSGVNSDISKNHKKNYVHFYGEGGSLQIEVTPVEPITKLGDFKNDAENPMRSNEIQIYLKEVNGKYVDYQQFEIVTNVSSATTNFTESGWSVFYLQCSNPIHCKLVLGFLQYSTVDSPKLSYLENGSIGSHEGSLKSNKSFDIPFQFTGSAGVIVCRSKDRKKYQYAQFYWSVSAVADSTKVLLYEESKTVSNIDPTLVMAIIFNQVLDLNEEMNRKTVTMNLTCTTSDFILEKGSRLFFELTNGNIVPPKKVECVSENLCENFLSEGEFIVRDDPRSIKSVICKAPLWNSDEWVTFTYPVSVPKIVASSTSPGSVSFSETAENVTIVCEAEGSPLPFVAWYLRGSPVEVGDKSQNAQDSRNQTNNVYRNELHFKRTNYSNGSSIGGTYTCNATNFMGTTTHDVTVTLEVTTDPKLKFLLIFASVFCLVSFLTVAVIVAVFLRKKHQLTKLEREFKGGLPRDSPPCLIDLKLDEASVGAGSIYKSRFEGLLLAHRLRYDIKYEVDESKLKILSAKDQEPAASGNFGIVERAELDKGAKKLKVAVKRLNTWNKEKAQDFLLELNILIFVNRERHENIVGFEGAITNISKGNIQIIMEYCEKGSLENFLVQNRDKFFGGHCGRTYDGYASVDTSGFLVHYSLEEDGFSVLDLLRWSYQFARGMEHLAKIKIIHADLAARNLLLTADRVLKIADFGLSRKLQKYENIYTIDSHSTRSSLHPWPSIAVECYELPYVTLSSATDVWGFGITLWEIFSLGEKPYASMEGTLCQQAKRILGGYRLEKPEHAPQQVYQIMWNCWNKNPELRPTFSELASAFEMLIKDNLEPEDGCVRPDQIQISSQTDFEQIFHHFVPVRDVALPSAVNRREAMPAYSKIAIHMNGYVDRPA